MSELNQAKFITNEKVKKIATQLEALDKNVILIYAFNGVGKTRLSVEYKNVTKEKNDNKHVGVYYNAYSEDLFIWDNDEDNDGENKRLRVVESSLNHFHSFLQEEAVYEKLRKYNVKYDFSFASYDDREKGIEFIYFSASEEDDTPIKISRGEQQIFIWCFFLALFEVEGWADNQNKHIFIDDPVSSLDDNNIFTTAATVKDLIRDHHENKKIIITTHHVGFFSIISNFLRNYEKELHNQKNEAHTEENKKTKTYILKKTDDKLELKNYTKDVLFYHLELLQMLQNTKVEDLKKYHIAFLRQILENLASYFGFFNWSVVLRKIGFAQRVADTFADKINGITHKSPNPYELTNLSLDEEEMLRAILEKLEEKYEFQTHVKKETNNNE